MSTHHPRAWRAARRLMAAGMLLLTPTSLACVATVLREVVRSPFATTPVCVWFLGAAATMLLLLLAGLGTYVLLRIDGSRPAVLRVTSLGVRVICDPGDVTLDEGTRDGDDAATPARAALTGTFAVQLGASVLYGLSVFTGSVLLQVTALFGAVISICDLAPLRGLSGGVVVRAVASRRTDAPPPMLITRAVVLCRYAATAAFGAYCAIAGASGLFQR